MGDIIHLNEEEVKVELGEMVRKTVEETLNGILLADRTDADVIQNSCMGVVASRIRIPTRHVHSQAEVNNLSDAQSAADLLTAFAGQAQ